MHIALYGGSFNPPHIFHQMACMYALSTSDVPIDEIWMIPCKDHPMGKNNIPFYHRFEMCKLAQRHLRETVKISDIESTLPGPSYTFNTVSKLSHMHPTYRFSFLLGSDAFQERKLWHHFDELDQLVDWIVVPRQGTGSIENFAFPNVSSTQVRLLLQKGNPPHHLLDREVLRYIEHHQLYNPKAHLP